MLITGGAGFIGSHAAIHFANAGWRVRVLDNLSRGALLGKADPNASHNWDRLAAVAGVERIAGDCTDPGIVRMAVDGVDVVIHAAAQTAVTISTIDPARDFHTNAIGTFTVLEALRNSGGNKAFIYCSTNKVYGARVNRIPLMEDTTRYSFSSTHSHGIPEDFGIDLCEHTPYGCSKLAGDLYVQDYGHLYGLKVGVFRMSCIYGTDQFGQEDQGWVAWFAIAALTGAAITVYGDGKQVRDVLSVSELVRAYEAFLASETRIGVYNIGGGPRHTLSLREVLAMPEQDCGRRILPQWGPWRPSDQKVYVSDIRKAERELGWRPHVQPADGVAKLTRWIRAHPELFAHLTSESAMA